MTKPKFRFEKPIIKSKTEPASKNVLWYFSQQKKGLTINTIKEYIKSQGWVDLFDTAPIELEEATFTENGIYENNENGWDKVIVDVPINELTSATFTSNGQYANRNGGWNLVNVNIPLNSITITENGNYNASEGGWNEVIVEVPSNESGNGYIIPYTSVDSNIVTPHSGSGFGATIIDNTYDKGLGIITFDGPVTSIAASAFFGRTTLSSIIIPNSVKIIGQDAFYGCFSLSSVTIGNSVESIGSCAFEGCSFLTSITIPESVTSIEVEAFAYCPSLTSVTCKATTPPTLESYNIMESSGVKVIYVPAESVESYKTATNWSYYSSIIQPIPES